MHGLFKDYLKLKLEHTPKGKKDIRTEREILAFKLYTMEEMFLWTWRRYGFLSRHTGIVPFFRENDVDILRSWQHSIAYHLCTSVDSSSRNGVESRDALIEYHQCYSTDFLAFAERVLGEFPEHPAFIQATELDAWRRRRLEVTERSTQQQRLWPMKFARANG